MREALETTANTSRIIINSAEFVDYFSVGVFIAIALIFSFFLVSLAFFRSARRESLEKTSPYECGFDPFGSGHVRFEIRYYLIAILFIIFDIEVAFLFPWAVSLQGIGWMGFWSMFIFLLVLAIGFVYEWRKGALEWK